MDRVVDGAEGGGTTATDDSPRRTQAERRAATEEALLRATFDCLVEDGYASLTTRRVAERAGVSQGNMRHYYPTKVELIAASMRDVLARLAAETVAQMRRQLDVPHRRQAMVDLIWNVHLSPAYRAMIELWVAAVREPDLREDVQAIEHDLRAEIHSATTALFPQDAEHPDADAIIETSLAAMRGLAFLAPVVDDRDFVERWARVRAEIVRLVSTPRQPATTRTIVT